MMRAVAGCVLFVLAQLWFGSVALAAAPILPLHPDQSAPPLREYVRYAIEPDLASAAQLGDARIARLRPMEHASSQFGQVDQNVLAVLSVRNEGATDGAWIFTTGRGSLTRFRMYVERGGRSELVLDNSVPGATGRVLARYQAFAHELFLQPGETARIIVQFRDENSSFMPLAIDSFADFFAARRINLVMTSAIFFGSLILIFFNVVLYMVTGRRAFIWLGAAEVAFAVNTLHAEGYSTILLLHAWPNWQAVFGDLCRSAFALLMVQFARVFLDTRARFAALDRLLRALVWIGAGIFACAVVAGFVPVLAGMALHLAGWAYTVLVALALPFVGGLAVRRLGAIYWPLLIAWAVMGVYIAYSAVAISGVFPSLPVAWHLVGPIGLFECAMATLTLGLHLRQLYLDRINAERAAKDVLLENLAVSNEATRLAEERARAIATIEARNKLIAASGHDTRHVLHALNSAVHFSRTTEGGTLPREELTQLIEASTRHLDDIIATTVSAADRQRPFVALGATRLERTLADIVAIYRPVAASCGIDLAHHERIGQPVLTDGALISRILSNLVNNAIKFTQTGSVTIETQASLGSFILRVRDTGTGIPERITRQLLDFTLPAAERCVGAGFGTGWRAICESVELLGGFYTIHSDPGGTVVEIELPDPLAGKAMHAITLDELAEEAPHFCFVDADADAPETIAAQAECAGSGRPMVMASRIDTSQQRMWIAQSTALLLLKPLCREMLEHPCAVALQTRPAALPSSTS